MTSQHSAARPARTRHTLKPRLIAAIAFGTAALAITGAGVFATLTETTNNTAPQSVASGTLSLTMANSGVGFSQGIANLAPGDTVNRFVTLTQGTSLDAQALTVGVADSTATKLTSDASKGLRLTIISCSAAWTVTNGTAACASPATTSTLLTSTALSSLITTPSSVVSGAVAKSSTLYLQMQLTLPDQAETTVNGATPATTIQGLSASLTWTFSETQRTATTTNS